MQPSGASIDDLQPAGLLFCELVETGIPKGCLVVALGRFLSQAEEDMARAYLAKAGYDVLPGRIPERTAYRKAQNRGQAVTETKHKALNARVDELMDGPYVRMVSQLEARRKRHKTASLKNEGDAMSRDDDVNKTLGGWSGKAKKMRQPPQPTETTGALKRPEHVRGYGGSEDGLTQLNFKIPHSTKQRITQLAVRDNITLPTMLDRLLELYEKEYGKLGRNCECEARKLPSA